MCQVRVQLVASFILSESWIDAKLYGESRGFLDWFRIDLSTLNTLLGKGAEHTVRDVVVCNSPCKSDWFLNRQSEQE